MCGLLVFLTETVFDSLRTEELKEHGTVPSSLGATDVTVDRVPPESFWVCPDRISAGIEYESC